MVQVVSWAKTQHRDIQFLMIAHAHLSETPFDASCSLVEEGRLLPILSTIPVVDGVFLPF